MPHWILPLGMAVLALGLFGDVLLSSHSVPADRVSDLRTQYLNWRQFAVSEVRSGHFPLWNPYSFCGTPFFGDPQSALLYPPNWLYLVLSPQRASTWLTVIHFFLAGYFTGLFCRWQGSTVGAAILAGTIYACCGPIITNLRPGHLPLLYSAAWAPLLLLCADRIFRTEGRARIRWTLTGMAVVALLALDGYPQFAFYTALCAGLYSILSLRSATTRRGAFTALAAMAAMFAGGWSIAAVQIMASAQVASESVRAGGLSYAAAGAFSLPPENLITLIAPGFFGDAVHLLYFGRWYWWETCLFVGPGVLILAAYAAPERRNRVWLAMVVAMLLLAMGSYTPLFAPLYRWLPAFGSFRATARFGLLGIFFVVVLAAAGWDRLASGDYSRTRRLAIAAAGVGAALALGAIWAVNSQASQHGDFTGLITALAATHQAMESLPRTDPGFADRAALFAAGQLAIASLATLLSSALLALSCQWRNASIAMALLAIGQVVWFAAGQRTRSDTSASMPPGWSTAINNLGAGQRVLLCRSLLAESGNTHGFFNVGGSNPLVLGRMGRFLAAIQDDDPAIVGLNYPIKTISNAYRMVRCGLVFPGQLGGPAYPIANPLPRLVLAGHISVAADSTAALASVLDENFDPAAEVVLESQPDILPHFSAGHDSMKLIHLASDAMEIEADLSVPQVLLITDAYSSGWKATPLEAGSPNSYRVLPGDYCLIAIPLSAGHHHFRLAYRPGAVVIGAWVSICAIAAYVAAICIVWRPAQTESNAIL